MAILFNKIERANPQDRTHPLRIRQPLYRRSKFLNRKEAEMSLVQLQKVLIRNLLASNSVQIGDWGSFHLTCNGEGSDTKEEVTAAKIQSLNIRFTPGKALRDALKGASFKPAESVVTGS